MPRKSSRRCPSTESMLVVSTGHVTEQEMKALRDSDGWIDGIGRIIVHEYGAIIAVTEYGDRKWPHNMKNVVGVLKYAHKCKIAWVNFDQDGNYLPGLPTYNW